MSNYHNKRASEILATIRYATVATVSSEGKPWNSPVYAVHDENLNIYWFSDKFSQHSQNIRSHEDVFIVIYDSTVPEGDGEGVYIQAKALELTDPEEIRIARRIKKGQDHNGSPEEFLNEASRRVYKAVPEQVWMNDAEEKNGVFVRDYRIEVPLENLKASLKK